MWPMKWMMHTLLCAILWIRIRRTGGPLKRKREFVYQSKSRPSGMSDSRRENISLKGLQEEQINFRVDGW